MKKEIATLAGGCFWCIEAVFDQLRGVESVESGYMGGRTANPSYEDICAGDTGHAEVVQVTFDPDQAAFLDILNIFFTVHDPTTLNRQGNDVGSQYRSAIFYHSPKQKAEAEAIVAEIDAKKIWPKPIVTEITPATTFYMAEAGHQEYFARVGASNPYCSFVIEPKVAKFRKKFFDRLKK
jgi:peptide-methionine (S)-S-oxide reductase